MKEFKAKYIDFMALNAIEYKNYEYFKGFIGGLQVAGYLDTYQADVITECFGSVYSKEYSEELHRMEFEF